MPDYNYNIPFGGYGELRYSPQMPGLGQQNPMGQPNVAGAFLNNGQMGNIPHQGTQAGSGDPQYQMKSQWQFGLNYQHIAASQAVQGVGAWLRQQNQRKDFMNYNKVEQNPIYQLPQNPNTSHQALYGDYQFRMGGRKYDTGGPGPNDPIIPPIPGAGTAQKLGPSSTDLQKADLSDYMSYNINNKGTDPEYKSALIRQATSQYGTDVGRKLVNSISMYNQRSDRGNYSGDAAINNYYSIPDPDKDVQNIKNQFKTFGQSPVQLFDSSKFIQGTNKDGSFKYLAQQAMGGPTSGKAKEILKDGTAQGHKLTDKQKGFFGWIAGGKKMAEGGFADELTQDDYDDLEDQVEELKGQIAGQPKTDSEPEEESKEQEPVTAEDDNSSEGVQTGKNNWAEFAQNTIKDSEWNPGDEEEDEPGGTSGTGPVSPAGMSMPDMSGHPLLEGFKHGIASSEGADYSTGNKSSTAFGKYQFTAPTRENVREQYFPNIKKDDFEYAYKNDPQFQEKVMDVYGGHLLQSYGGNVHEAATAFFLGEGKANMYNQPSYRPTPNNATVGQYLNKFDQGYNQKFKEGGTYELTEPQIKYLKTQGYEIENI